MNAALRHAGQSRAPQQFKRQSRGGPAARIHPVKLPGPLLMNDREQIAANAIHHRRHDAHHGIRRDCRVDRVPSAREDHSAGLRSQGMFGGDDAPRGHDHRASLRTIDVRTNVVYGRRSVGCFTCHLYPRPQGTVTRCPCCSGDGPLARIPGGQLGSWQGIRSRPRRNRSILSRKENAR